MSETKPPYVTHSDLVRALAQQPQDDATREQAIHDLRVVSVIAAVVDDYEFAIRQAGDLGGCELL